MARRLFLLLSSLWVRDSVMGAPSSAARNVASSENVTISYNVETKFEIDEIFLASLIFLTLVRSHNTLIFNDTISTTTLNT